MRIFYGVCVSLFIKNLIILLLLELLNENSIFEKKWVIKELFHKEVWEEDYIFLFCAWNDALLLHGKDETDKSISNYKRDDANGRRKGVYRTVFIL